MLDYYISDVLNIVEALNRCKNLEQINALVRKQVSQYGVEHFLAGIMPNQFLSASEQKSHILFGQWPNEWGERYFEKGYLEYDPTIKHVRMKRDRVLQWNKIRSSHNIVMNEASEFGLSNGLTIPMISLDGARIGVSFAGRYISESENARTALQLIASLAVGRVLELYHLQASLKPKDCPLTKREKDCLSWIAEGKSNCEISIILGISEKTVEVHVSNILRKLDSNNRTGMVVTAIRKGLLH